MHILARKEQLFLLPFILIRCSIIIQAISPRWTEW